jgi:putative holliday junction resolvase
MAAGNKTLLALDVGERRVGVARAQTSAGIASPLTTLERSDNFLRELQTLIDENQAATLVIGLPRGLDGQETAQTGLVRQFVAEIRTRLDIPIVWQDEALTSRKAEAELTARGKPYAKAEVDALAATYILEDYMVEYMKGSKHVA